MRTPFRLTLPNWFGDPGPELRQPRAAVLPLWRRAAESHPATTRPAPATSPSSRLPHGRPAGP